jgi:hypothetical protein
MTGMVAWQVFCRYVLNDSPSWTEPGAVMLMSWFIFLGAAVGVRENYHLGFDVLLYVVPKGGKIWLRMISDLVALRLRRRHGLVRIGQLVSSHLEHDPCRRCGISGGWELRAPGRGRRAQSACSRWSASCCALPGSRSTTFSTSCRRRRSRPSSTPLT